jgi:type II secretory pathway component GspD/PulD (secretin)
MSSVSTAATGGAGGGSYSAGAFVPFTQTFVQSDTITTPITLVGQILDNGQTNFLGYDEGSAVYILPSSAADATQTTLANGQTYFVSEGAAPGGYLLTSGGSFGPAETGATGAGGRSSTATARTNPSTSTRAPTTTTRSQTGGGSGSGATVVSTTTTSGIAERMEVGGWVAGMVFGLLAVFGL